MSAFLALRSDQLAEKMKDMRAKRKISLEESEASGAEGPSNSKPKRERSSSDNDSLGKLDGGKTELSKQLTVNMDIVQLPQRPSKKENKKNHCGSLHSESSLSSASKDPKAPNLAQSGLEQIMKTLADMTKLKVKIQEKQTAVLNARQKNKKCAQREMLVLEQELHALQDQLCAEQAYQQQRVKQLEKTYEELEVGRYIFILNPSTLLLI